MGDIHLDRALSIDGWMSPLELKWLAYAAKVSYKILEIGSYKGRSTRALCDNTRGIVQVIDPWEGPYYTNNNKVLFEQSQSWVEFQQNTSDVKNLLVFRGYFHEFAKINTVRNFDFVFIDGDHRYETVIHDIDEGLKILKPGGILAGHDYTHPDWPGVKQAVDEKFPIKETVDSIWAITK
jgi:predicted O-methyltransferase YrrM